MDQDPDSPDSFATWSRHAARLGLQEQHWPDACLYMVPTPIGNLADLSPRAWYALQLCDAIAAEDTRTSRKLLQAWGIHTPLLAAHRHNEAEAADRIIERLRQRQRIALVSDAGSPAISDPGARIVRRVQSAGMRIMPLPGPTAVITALMASGATCDANPGFVFAGFPPARSLARQTWLARVLAQPLPVVLFEAPHRLSACLSDMMLVLPGSRQLTLARELSKRFEEIHSLPLDQAPSWLAAEARRMQGEFVVVVHADSVSEPASTLLDEQQHRLMQTLLEELSLRDAVRVGAKVTGIARSRLYDWALAQQADRPA